MDVHDKWGEEMKEQRMSDLINRKDVIALIKPMVGEFTDNGFMVDYERVLSILEEIPSADRPRGEWIPCSDRLPKEKEVVLITNDKGNLRFGQFRGTHGKYWIWKGNTLETVLAWMPLPEPWKGADDE